MKRLLVALVIFGIATAIVCARKKDGPVDSWFVDSGRERTPAGDRLNDKAVLVAARHRPEAIVLLGDEVAIELDEATLKRLQIRELERDAGCTPYLVRALAYENAESATHHTMDGSRVDVESLGGFSCKRSKLHRAPFVGCLAVKPTEVVTSFWCESLF